jgi:hypothetical protein
MIDKREIIKQYKQNPPEMGIFQIKNKINGKILIGKAKNLMGILNRNKFQLKNGTHVIKELQDDFNKFGEENFIFEQLDSLKPKDDFKYDYTEDLELLEELWLEKLQPYNEKGYNLKKIK